MPKVLIIYDSRTGNTEAMANLIAEGAKEVEGIGVSVKRVDETEIQELLDYEGIIIGSPVYIGIMTSKIKSFIDQILTADPSKMYPLENKVGAAFCSLAGGSGAGGETTVLSILTSMLIEKMIIVGPEFKWGRLGAIVTGEPKSNYEIELCKGLGRKVAKVVKKLYGNSR
ncbi:MAG: NAD(P)H-dependent oxidoreductase [Candidatus Bathyarchaeia archaeon]